MARIVYALSGQGRGHTSRVLAISDLLRRAGHEVTFCCGGTAREILEAQGETVIPVPALRQVMEGNAVCLGQTIRVNWKKVLGAAPIIERLADAFLALRPDLLITDFEAYSWRAADRIGLPVLSFNHQQVLTETHYDLAPRYWFNAGVTLGAINMIAPRHPRHVLLTSFFFPRLKRPERTTLVPPIIREAVQELVPRTGEHVLVYYNQPEGADYVLETLRSVDAEFVVYNFEPADPDKYPNLHFKQPSLEGFLHDLAGSRAVICTAGFTLISEALYLGKPLLVVPNRGIFEQTLNALFLDRDGLGRAVIDRSLTRHDVVALLNEAQPLGSRLRQRDMCGNREAVTCIEGVLAQVRPTTIVRPGLPSGNGAAACAADVSARRPS